MFLNTAVIAIAAPGDVMIGGGALYVPAGGDTFEGNPAVEGVEIDSGWAFFLNASHRIAGPIHGQAEAVWYQSETSEVRQLPGVGPATGTLDLEGIAGFLNVLFRPESPFGWDPLFLEIGAGIGYSSFKNTATVEVVGFREVASDRDEAIALQGFANIGFQVTESLALGASARVVAFDDLRWEDRGEVIEANDVRALGYGLFANIQF